MNLATFTIKRKYQKIHLCTEQLICQILKLIQTEETVTPYKIRKELGINMIDLSKYISQLTYCNAITQLERKYGSKRVKCYEITEKGSTLIIKYDILLSLLPLVWQGETE